LVTSVELVELANQFVAARRQERDRVVEQVLTCLVNIDDRRHR
jgi:hypothetical protein